MQSGLLRRQSRSTTFGIPKKQINPPDLRNTASRKASEEHIERLWRAREADLQRSHDQLNAALQTRTSLINALPANIAMLDADSRIVDVNNQWRDFAKDNGLPDPEYGVGQNYLALCERAARNGEWRSNGLDPVRIAVNVSVAQGFGWRTLQPRTPSVRS